MDRLSTPDNVGTGTNAVVIGAHAHRGLCFGPNSFPRYLAWAAREGWSVTVCNRPELTFDLDTPADWEEWVQRAAHRQSHGNAGIRRESP